MWTCWSGGGPRFGIERGSFPEAQTPWPSVARERVKIGRLEIDAVTFPQALERIAELVDRRNGGAVFTPNVDHIVKAERDSDFRRAYSRADLCLGDGMPLVWASRLLGSPLPEKVSGSDLVLPLIRMAAERRWRVYLLGGAPGGAEAVAERLNRELGAQIVGTDAPVVDVAGTSDDSEQTLERLRAASPDVVLVAFGAPKQELWIERFRDRIRPPVAIGVGGSLDFVAGTVKRARRGCPARGSNGSFVSCRNHGACGGATSSKIQRSSR